MLRRMCYTHIDSVLVDLDDVVVDVHVDHVHGVVVLVHGVAALRGDQDAPPDDATWEVAPALATAPATAANVGNDPSWK